MSLVAVGNPMSNLLMDHPAMAPGSGMQKVYLGNLGMVVISGEIPAMLINGGWYTNWCPQCGIGRLCNFTCRGPLGFWVRLVPQFSPDCPDSPAPVNYVMQYMPNPAIRWHYGSHTGSSSGSPEQRFVTAAADQPQLQFQSLGSSGSPPFQYQPQQQQMMRVPEFSDNSEVFMTPQQSMYNSMASSYYSCGSQQRFMMENTNWRSQDIPGSLENQMEALAINGETSGDQMGQPRQSPRPGPSSLGRLARAGRRERLKAARAEALAASQAGEPNNDNGGGGTAGAVTDVSNGTGGESCKSLLGTVTTLKRVFCGFCFTNGEAREFYRAHALRDPIGRIQCPVLLRYRCDICGGTGQEAHTESYCSKRAIGGMTGQQRRQGQGQGPRQRGQARRNYQSQWSGRRNATGVIVRPRRFPRPIQRPGSGGSGSGSASSPTGTSPSSSSSDRTLSTSTTSSI